MKIIKPGSITYNDPLYMFTCDRCGGVFTANQSECAIESDMRNGNMVSHECPTAECGRTVYGRLCRNASK